jgi:hypothetical protein
MEKLKKLAGILFTLILLLSLLPLSGCGTISKTPDILEKERQAIIAQAISYQTEGGVYQADIYEVTKLKKGDIIYGMLPGQSVFYLDKATADMGKGNYKTLYTLAQIRPHPIYGYRTKLGKYEVLEDMYVPCGTCLANKTITIDGKNENLGDGGGFQYVIFDYESKLKLLEEITLNE